MLWGEKSEDMLIKIKLLNHNYSQITSSFPSPDTVLKSGSSAEISQRYIPVDLRVTPFKYTFLLLDWLCGWKIVKKSKKL